MSCPYIFPSASRCPRDDVEERVGQVTIAIKGVVPTTKRDVAKIPALLLDGDRRRQTHSKYTSKKKKKRY